VVGSYALLQDEPACSRKAGIAGESEPEPSAQPWSPSSAAMVRRRPGLAGGASRTSNTVWTI